MDISHQQGSKQEKQQAPSIPLVVHIIHRLDYGGLENGLVNIINTMPKDRYRHVIICLTTFTDFRSRIKRDDVEVYALNKKSGKNFFCFWRLWKLLRRLKPTIVHTRNLAALGSIVIAAFAGVPVRIHGEHGRDIYDIDGKNWKYNIIRRLCSIFTHRHIPMSRDLAHWLHKTVGITPSHIVHIYNGVDGKRFHPATGSRELLPKKDFAAEDHIVVGYIGNMEAVKDPLTLVRAFVFLQDAVEEAAKKLRLVMVGDGTQRRQIETLIESAKLDDRIWFAGARDDVAKFYRGFDIFVLPSIVEGISNTILEAMASGLPVIATKVGGTPELVTENENGFLVRPSHHAEIVDALLRYVKKPELIKQHGQNARRRIEQEFSLTGMVDRYMALYDTMVATLK